MNDSSTAQSQSPGDARDVQLKQNEEAFHDEWAASLRPDEVLVDESWDAVTCPEHRWIRAQLQDRVGSLRGKRVLDLGCGAGEAAVWFAKQGADVVASDLSEAFLTLVKAVAARHSVELTTHHADADNLSLPDDSFDIVYAGNLLHHVDTVKTLGQIHRLLRPGGIVVTWDPLKHNPVINIYRRMASVVRTPDEHPLHINDVRLFDRGFTEVEHQCFWLATLWIFLRFYLIERVHPSQQRYWKKIIIEHERLTPIYNRLRKIDDFVLRVMPFARRYCWSVAICARKSDSLSH